MHTPDKFRCDLAASVVKSPLTVMGVEIPPEGNPDLSQETEESDRDADTVTSACSLESPCCLESQLPRAPSLLQIKTFTTTFIINSEATT